MDNTQDRISKLLSDPENIKTIALIASGFIAGGALMGVVSAGLTFAGCDWAICGGEWMTSTYGQILSVAAYALIVYFLIKTSLKAK